MNHSLNAQKGTGVNAGKVLISSNGMTVALRWQVAAAFARELMRPGAHPSANPHVVDIRVLENGHVDVLLQGKLWFSADAADTARIGKSIKQVADLVEEESDHERITQEQALLTRTGAPFGITSHPLILKDAKLEAEHGSNLRRYVPIPSFRGRAMIGLPTIQQFSPDPKRAALEYASTLPASKRREFVSTLKKEIADGNGG